MENKKRVLIIEDDQDISMIEEVYLESAGFETKIIIDGTKAADLLDKEKFDLVLLDIIQAIQQLLLQRWQHFILQRNRKYGNLL